MEELPFGPTLLLVWEEYRKSAKRSRELKGRLDRTRTLVLCLVILGSILGLLADQSRDWVSGTPLASWMPQGFALMSAIGLALAAVLSKEILDSKTEREWVFARSQAEALKSEAYKFMAKAPPYAGPDAENALSEQAKLLLGDSTSVAPVELGQDEKRKCLPKEWLPVDAYIRERVEEQITGYYEPNARRHHRMLTRLRFVGLSLGCFGAVLGAIGAGVPGATWTAGWVAVIGAVAGAVAAFAFAGRYQYLATSYELTNRRLRWLVHDWVLVPEADKPQKAGQFITDCENAISVENHNWLAKWTKKTSTVRQ